MPQKLDAFIEQHKVLSEADFAAKYPHPLLVVEVPLEETQDSLRHAFSTSTSHPTVAELEKERDAVPTVFPIFREGGSAVSMITVGRTRISDVFLDHPSISKLHAYFRQDGPSGAFTVTDAGSTNGTTLNGRQLIAKESVEVGDGDEIVFADYLKGTFRSAEGFYRASLRHA